MPSLLTQAVQVLQLMQLTLLTQLSRVGEVGHLLIKTFTALLQTLPGCTVAGASAHKVGAGSSISSSVAGPAPQYPQ
jgi:hypothetical protein